MTKVTKMQASQLHFKIFDAYQKLVYGLSNKLDGGMSRVKDYRSNKSGYNNRKKFLDKHQINIRQTNVAGLAHSANVFVVGKNHKLQIIPNVDGLITKNKNIYLTVTVADCFPVFLFDPKNLVVGLAHAGWRGIVGNIIQNTLVSMQKEFGSGVPDLLAGIGPGIQTCHFEINDDVLPRFADYQNHVISRSGKIFVDLPALIRQQLLEIGLKSDNIEISGECTYCMKDKYFSYRRDKKLRPMLAFIGIN